MTYIVYACPNDFVARCRPRDFVTQEIRLTCGKSKGKYARTRDCLIMKTTDLKHFMLRFISNDYGDNHQLRTREISPGDNSSSITRCYLRCF